MPIVASEASRLLGKTSRPHPRAQWPRAPIAAASIVTAAAHIPVTGEHLHEAFPLTIVLTGITSWLSIAIAWMIRAEAKATPWLVWPLSS